MTPPREDTPRPKQELARTPEEREALQRQFLEESKEFVAATPDDRLLLRRQYEQPASPIRWYILKNSSERLTNPNEQSWKFEVAQQPNQSGWLGCQLDGDTLLIVPADQRFFSEGNAKFILKSAIIKLAPDEIAARVGDNPLRITDIKSPAILKTESWMIKNDPRTIAARTEYMSTTNPRPGYYKTQTPADLEMTGFMQGDTRRKEPNPLYAARALETAARFRAADEAAQMRESEARAQAERADQLRLLERVRALKRVYDELDKKRQETAMQLEKDSKVPPFPALLQAVRTRVSQLSPDQRSYLENKLSYRVPSESYLATLRRHRGDAQQASSQIGFFAKLGKDGKAVEAYLTEVATMLEEGRLQQAQSQTQDLERRRAQFTGDDQAAYAQSRSKCEKEAVALFSGEIENFFKTYHPRTNKYPTRMKEWDEEGLQQWLGGLKNTAERGARGY